jgi:dipeptidyl aminopeptidase/acylaminoacyl peptidase
MRGTTRHCVGLAFALCTAVASALPSVADFTNYPQYQSMQISPDGKLLAITQRDDTQEFLAVMNFPELKTISRTSSGATLDIASVIWANNTRLLIQPQRRVPGETSFKQPTGEIFGIDADGKNFDVLFGISRSPGSGRFKNGNVVFAAGEVIDLLPDDPDNVLIQSKGFGLEGDQNAVYRMNIQNGKLAKVYGSPINNGNFLTDTHHAVTVLSGLDYKGDFRVYHRPDGKGEWQLKETFPAQKGNLHPIRRTTEPNQFLAIDTTAGQTSAVVLWNPGTGEKKPLFQQKETDIAAAGYDPENRAWMFGYMDHFPGYFYTDPQHPLALLHQSLRATFRDAAITISSQTRDMSMAVAFVASPTFPPRFLIMDVRSRKILQTLPAYANLKAEDLSPMDPIEFRSRDGKTIRGYLTTPKGTTNKKLPTIVLAHGGPHGVYDSYGFNPEVQLLASRGYAVLQVNYRGSGGRGLEFESAGFGKWGREMQDDIADGVKWAIADGVADSARICIMGTSYGAYAALTGAFREPGMFRCAVGMSGVYDLPLLFDKGDIAKVERGQRYLKEAVGTDKEELRRRSPTYNADKIKIPVMLIHGSLDRRAPVAHATRLKAALEKAGNPPEWLTEIGEAHGFADEKHRAEAYEKILAFLGKHL